MYFEIGLTEFTNRLCVVYEGIRGTKDDAKILWADQWEERYCLLRYVRISENVAD